VGAARSDALSFSFPDDRPFAHGEIIAAFAKPFSRLAPVLDEVDRAIRDAVK
jgi:hypothetical protein